jgi:hypothetical protein
MARAAVSYAAWRVFDSHSRHRQERRWWSIWPTAVRVCGLSDALGDLSSCFDSVDDSFRLRGDAQAVPVANVATIFGE